VEEEYCIETIPNEAISLVFLAPVRNAMDGLPYFQANLKKVKRAYPNSRVVFLENDSTDDTLNYIHNNFNFLESNVIHPNIKWNQQEALFSGRSCQRIERMMLLRNQLLEHVKKEDIVIPVDADWPVVWPILEFIHSVSYLLENPNIQGVVPLFLVKMWFCPFFDTYGDTFAYSDEEHLDTTNSSWNTSLKLKKWTSEDPIPVHSAFGSLAIYKKPANDVFYEVSQSESGNCRCEHVSFNEKIGKIELLPWFKIKGFMW
jgi:hypothetical protein